MADDNANPYPPDYFLYTGKGSIPRNARRVEVHRSVEEIPHSLFVRYGCDPLESVLLHEGLRKIGSNAFRDCSSLRIFHCPSTVTKIGYEAFYGCSNLAAIELPKGLEAIEDWTFAHCTSLEEVKIPTPVARIGFHAFCGCTNLASVELSEGLRLIERKAFVDCSSLESLRVPSPVEEIGKEVFDGCTSLMLIQMSEDLPKMKRFAFGGCPSLERFEFVGLSKRMKAMRMDDQTKSMFESRLSEMTLVLTRENDEDVDEDDNEYYSDEDDPGAVWEKCKESLGRAHEVLTCLELKGAMPVLELALWKAKIDGEGEEEVQGESVIDKDGGQDLSDSGRERKRPKVMDNTGQDTRLSREDCRVKCGAGIEIPEVLKFFTYSTSWPQLDDSDERNAD